MKVKQIVTGIVMTAIVTSLILPSVEAGVLFHATEKQMAKKIAARGFSSAKMCSQARFGKGVYLGTSRKVALAEKPGANAVVDFKPSKFLGRNSLNLYRPSTQKLKKLCPNTSLQGKVKHQVIGQNLGKKLGRTASRRNQAIIYHSSKQPNGHGKCIFIPNQVYHRHPRIVRPYRIEKGRMPMKP